MAQKCNRPVVVVGDSAGGNLAAAVCHATRGESHTPIGQVLIYPGLSSDLTQGTFVEHAHAPMLTLEETKFYKSTRTAGDAKLLAQKHCTPLNDSDFNGLPPTILVSAQCDPLSDNGKDYCNEILTAGGKAIWFNETGLVHGFLRGRHSVTRIKNAFTRITNGISSLGQNEWPYN